MWSSVFGLAAAGALLLAAAPGVLGVLAECGVSYPTYIGDGGCDSSGNYNTMACGWDGGDCCTATGGSSDYYCLNPLYRPSCNESISSYSYLGDGGCASFGYYNTDRCGWDGGDCCTASGGTDGDYYCEDPDNQPSGCAAEVSYYSYVGDGSCDSYGGYNTEVCDWDGGDCCTATGGSDDDDCLDPDNAPAGPSDACVAAVSSPYWIGDGGCDSSGMYNTALCDWDGGDCCTATGGNDDDDCLDPDNAPARTSPTGLGEGYSIAALDLKSLDWVGEGTTVFDLSAQPSCLSTSDTSSVTYEYNFYQEQHDFSSSLGVTTDTSVGAAVVDYSASVTVSTAFSQASASATTLASSSLRQSNIISHTSVAASCLSAESAYAANLLKDFQALPTKLQLGSTGFASVPTATGPTTWKAYAGFTNLWGSHVITGAHTGAAVEVLATATSSDASSSADFVSATCAQGAVLGITAKECVGYNTSSSTSSSSSSIATTTHFYGGSAELSIAAEAGANADDVAAFLKSGTEDTAAYFTYTPLWTLLGKVYGTKASIDNQRRVQLLKGYYTEYLAEMHASVDNCWVQGVDYQDHDIGDTPLDNFDPAACQAACAARISCTHWTLREDNRCYFKSSNEGMRITSSAVSGPAACESRRESGYEVLVSDNGGAAISFTATPCEFPVATTSAQCISCGNNWATYEGPDYTPAACDWWNCDEASLNYCSSPAMQTLPDDWVTRVATQSHYGNPSNGCMEDEATITASGFDASVCAPTCAVDGACSADVPEGVTATPACLLTASDGTRQCALQCSSSADCGTLAHCLTSAAFSVCMY